MRLTLLLLCLLPCTGLNQTLFQSRTLTYPKSGNIDLSNPGLDWEPYLQRLEMPGPGTEEYRSYLNTLKASRNDRQFSHYPSMKGNDTIPAPIIIKGIEGNNQGSGAPLDNDLAISNDGIIVSVTNSKIWVIDAVNDTILSKASLQLFADSLGLSAHKYDPRVLYDYPEDRFIVVFLSGSSSNATHIVVGFSATGDPAKNWHLYALPGNPVRDTTWSDYPMIVVNENDLFITINSLRDNSSWQEGFVETLIWQIDKSSGYQGDSLKTALYYNIRFNGKPVRNLCPVKGGEGYYGDQMYFLSNRNFALSNDTVFILKLTGSSDDFQAVNLQITHGKTDLPYGLPPKARQKNGHFFDTNDARVLDAFYEDGLIHYVQNTIGGDSGFASIYHGIIDDPGGANTITGYIISDTVLDFGYPEITYTGKYDGDNEAIITYNHVAPTVPSGFSATFYSNGRYSRNKKIITGNGLVNVILGYEERWGDYTGAQRKYDEPGIVWAAGSYAAGGFDNGTWIASLASPDTTSSPPVAVNTIQPGGSKIFRLYPNPVNHYVNCEFTLPQEDWLTIAVYNTSGQQVKTLLEDRVPAGKHRFTFSSMPLSPGIWILSATGQRSGKVFSLAFVKN